jgi:hypothetical protein
MAAANRCRCHGKHQWMPIIQQNLGWIPEPHAHQQFNNWQQQLKPQDVPEYQLLS